MGDLFAKADLEAEVGAENVARVFDDDRDGVADNAAIAAIVEDVESRALGKLRGIYVLPLETPIDPLLKAVCRRLGKALAAQRHTEFSRMFGKGEELLKAAMTELDEIRAGKTQIDHPLVDYAAVVACEPDRGWGA